MQEDMSSTTKHYCDFCGKPIKKGYRVIGMNDRKVLVGTDVRQYQPRPEDVGLWVTLEGCPEYDACIPCQIEILKKALD